MYAVTWRPGTDSLYDPLFDHLRERQYRDHDHPLWKNYNQEHFIKECLALTIAFNEYNLPVLCSSVLSRACWPKQTYRILNRLWAVSHSVSPIKNLMPEGSALLKSQINWLKENTNVELVFISRDTANWQQWTVKQYQKNYELDFEFDDYKYQVCNDACDDTCWQRIVYQGNKELLTSWSRKLPNE